MNTRPESPSEFQRILRERARRLAQPLQVESPGDTRAFVVAALSGEHYGFAVEDVLEVLKEAGLTPLPGTASFWLGLINLRGRLAPVLDLRAYLGLAPMPSGQPGRIIIAEQAGLLAGLLVDDVLEVRNVPVSQIGPPLAPVSVGGRQTIAGLTFDFLAIIDLQKLLSDPRLVVQED